MLAFLTYYNHKSKSNKHITRFCYTTTIQNISFTVIGTWQIPEKSHDMHVMRRFAWEPSQKYEMFKRTVVE